ncbi:isoprenylcysteine carboxylmethyltransferase family protein [Tessaracoccus sp. OS52]|uniref:methyltransferase family protein n=1 Tax=Tessaracoccus sp. OS52 TaxID=2886691 RepID=UPI001D1039E8|nr:isoprenylcysteine carboxylmethyltransferase family protein [Tessaracoccus sp. OS52]MCC2594105.1 isoprenylcysteine carboxylmethyltransferase family protein [Tessaracoccus sp. OS52]
MSESTTPSRPLDYELLILGPVLVLLLWVNVSGLANQWASGDVGWLELLQTSLTTCFYLLLVVLLVTRRPARRTSRSWVATIGAYLGTFLPFAMILNFGPMVSSPVLTVISIAVMIVGLGFSIYAVSWLGRSFGAVPAARRLVRKGPYRIVRHPLYAAEFVTFIGVVLGQLTLFSAALFAASVAVQVYRALQEEKVLTEAFPEYQEYSEQTRRFIPGVI